MENRKTKGRILSECVRRQNASWKLRRGAGKLGQTPG
jgi:hypothetical protein